MCDKKNIMHKCAKKPEKYENGNEIMKITNEEKWDITKNFP